MPEIGAATRALQAAMGARVALVLCFTCLACGAARSDPRADAAAPPAAVATWDDTVAEIARERTRLAAAWRAADSATERARVRDRASRYLVDAITTRLVPPWLGMPWGMGRDSTATRPHEDGKRISCSYFVGAILQGADFRLANRFRLGQAAALIIQRSLVGAPGKVHRYLSIPPADLAARVRALGDGVYVIGLDVHVGLVVVRGDDVRFVHASYTGDQVVSDEPLADALAIARSQPRGYFVSPLVTAAGAADDWLIERWLAGDEVGP